MTNTTDPEYARKQAKSLTEAMTSSKPTDSEQLIHFANSIGWKLGKTTANYVRSGFVMGMPGFGMMSAEAMASLWERDQQRLSAWTKERATYRRMWIPKVDVLSAALEAVDNELIPVSHYTECLRLLHDDDATIPDDCSCGAELRMKQALIAALGPDNSKIEE
jgi:hypothetical protein